MANYRSGVAQGPRADLTLLGLNNGAGAYDYGAPSGGAGNCVSDDYNWIMVGQNWQQTAYDYLYNFADDPISSQQPLGRRYYMIFNEPDRNEALFLRPEILSTRAAEVMRQLRLKDANCRFIGFNIAHDRPTTWNSFPGNPSPIIEDTYAGIRGAQRYMWDVLAYWADQSYMIGPCRLWRPTFHAYGYSDDPVAAAHEIRDICNGWKDFWGNYAPAFASILPEIEYRPIITEIGPHPFVIRSSTWYASFFNELYSWLSSNGVQEPVPIAGWAWYNCHPWGDMHYTHLHDSGVVTSAGLQYKIFADRW